MSFLKDALNRYKTADKRRIAAGEELDPDDKEWGEILEGQASGHDSDTEYYAPYVEPDPSPRSSRRGRQYVPPPESRGRTRNRTAARSDRSRSREDPEVTEFKHHLEEHLKKLEKMTVLLHQPVTGIEGQEAPMQVDKGPKYIPPPLIVSEYTSEGKEKILHLRKIIVNSLKGLQKKQYLMGLIGEPIQDINQDNRLITVKNEERIVKWPRTVIYYLAEDSDPKEFSENIHSIWPYIKNFESLRQWIFDLQKVPSELTKSDFEEEYTKNKITALQDQLARVKTTLESARTIVADPNAITGMKQKLYEGIIGKTSIGTTASLFTNIYVKVNKFFDKYVRDIEGFEQSTIDLLITAYTTAFTIFILMLLVPSEIGVLKPALDSVKTILNSFVVINFSEVISIFIGELLNEKVGIPFYLAKACEVGKKCHDNISSIYKKLETAYNNIENLYNEPTEDKSIEVLTEIKDIYNLTHEDELLEAAYEKIGEEMDTEHAEAEEAALQGMVSKESQGSQGSQEAGGKTKRRGSGNKKRKTLKNKKRRTRKRNKA